MTTIELKDILIHKIAAINDKLFLAAMNTIIDTKSKKNSSIKQLLSKDNGLKRDKINSPEEKPYQMIKLKQR